MTKSQPVDTLFSRHIAAAGSSFLQTRYQTESDIHPLQLEVRPQIDRRLIVAGIFLVLLDFNGGAGQRPTAFRRFARIDGVAIDVVGDPVVQVALQLLLLLVPADPVANDDLEIVRKSSRGEHVRQPRRQVTRCRRFRVVLIGLRLEQRLGADKRGPVGVLAMDQGDQSGLGKLRLAPVGDCKSTPPSSVGKVWVGKFSTSPPDWTPRIRTHQPYSLKARLMLAAIA